MHETYNPHIIFHFVYLHFLPYLSLFCSSVCNHIASFVVCCIYNILKSPLDTPSAEAMMEEGGDEEDDTFPTSKRQSVEGILAGPSVSTDRYRTSSAASIVSRLLNRGDSSNSIGCKYLYSACVQ